MHAMTLNDLFTLPHSFNLAVVCVVVLSILDAQWVVKFIFSRTPSLFFNTISHVEERSLMLYYIARPRCWRLTYGRDLAAIKCNLHDFSGHV